MVVSGKWELGWGKAVWGFALLKALRHLTFKIRYIHHLDFFFFKLLLKRGVWGKRHASTVDGNIKLYKLSEWQLGNMFLKYGKHY